MANIHIIYPDIGTGFIPGFHHGLAFLAGALRNKGHNLTFEHITKPLSEYKVAKRALQTNPLLIGISLTHNQINNTKKYINAIRELKKKSFIVAGGVAPSLTPEYVLEQLCVDAIAIGEAELSFLSLIDSLEKNENHAIDTEGFYFRNFDGKIITNPPPQLAPDISKLPLPDYSIFDIKTFLKRYNNWTVMLIIRGCPFRCHYCCNSALMNIYPNKKSYFRLPSVEYAIRLIKHNLTFANGIKGILFDDDLMCLDKEWFLSFTDAYKNEIGLPYVMNSRVETINDDIIIAMKNSGCRVVKIGIESGNEWVRKNLLNRYYTNQQLRETFDKLKKSGILVFTFNMLGLPFETKSQMLETLNINKKLMPYRGNCSFFFPYPKTKLYQICKEFNLLKEDSEETSGYYIGPAIKLTHCTVNEAMKVFSRLRFFLFLNRFLSDLKLSALTKIIYYSFAFLAGRFNSILIGDSPVKYKMLAIANWFRKTEN